MGCRGYRQRSTVCSEFRCTWLSDDSWPRHWRPDHSGLLCLREKIHDGRVAAVVYETAAGALESPNSKAIIEALRATTDIVVTVDGQQNRQRIDGSQPASEDGRSHAA
jgi:hypothetical protein